MSVKLEKILRPYESFYGKGRTTIYATSLYEAKQRAIQYFNTPRKKEHMVSVVLDGDGHNVLW